MGPAERALVAPERLQGCVRELEAEKAKMEVFRRELPISVRLVADVIEWLKDELKAQPEGGRAEADDKSSWMSSAQLWTCGGGLDHTTGNGSDQAHKLSTPPTALPSLAGSTRAAAERPVAVPLPDLSLSSPATAPSAATTDATTSSSRRSGRPGGAGRPSCTAGSSPLCSGSAARKLPLPSRSGS